MAIGSICVNRVALNVVISLMMFSAGFKGTAGQAGTGASAREERLTGMKAVQLKCEHLTDPLGVEAPQPRLSWVLESNDRGQLQTAFQILVATSLQKLEADRADKWDSGQIASDNSVEVPYKGSPLTSGERCYWKVRSWGKDGKPGAYSAASYFEMGLLKQADWQGKWIGSRKGISSPLLRREFRLETAANRARVYLSGLGYYELYINGKRVGDRVLDPASTYYTNDQPFKLYPRVLYASYDVTDLLLNAGPNVIGVMLGHGWYSAEADVAPRRAPYGDRPCLILQMNVDLSNGHKMSLSTDDSWKTSAGPITYNDLFHGEAYDARLERPGWDKPGYDDAQWEKAVLAEPPGGTLTAEVFPANQVTETLKPIRVIKPKAPELFAEAFVYDFGQNFSGWVKIRVSGPRGATITLKYGAKIYPEDDSLDNRSNTPPLLDARQTDTYILKGQGMEEWEPRFTLHGFRYVEVRGFSDLPALESIEGRFVHSALKPTGTFTCSEDLINKIHHNIQWTFASSLQGLIQDAADRAERQGWLGDPGFVAEDYIYNFDMTALWEKWLNDMQDIQKNDGNLPFVAPLHWRAVPGQGDSLFDTYAKWPVFQSTYPLLIWYLYQYYGDNRVLEEHYASLKKLIDFQGTTANHYTISFGLGDHMEPQDNGRHHFSPLHTPASLTSTAFYYYGAWILSRVAELLGKDDDARRYSAVSQNIKDAFNQKFLNKASNQYATGSQTSNALPLYFEMVPDERIPAVMKNLVDDIVVKHNGHQSTGIVGTNALAQALPRYGASEVMYQIVTQTTFPSLGYQISLGATTLCETLNCEPWLSQNMKMFGSVDKFFYRNLAGIGLGGPGYRHILIKPQLVGDLKSVTASLDTVRGRIAVEWVKGDSSFQLKVSIPTGSEADITIPKLGNIDAVVTESDKTIWKADAYVPGVPGLTSGADNGGSVTFHAGSGTYKFDVSGSPF
jgi:alpha-L-rhamnosidase